MNQKKSQKKQIKKRKKRKAYEKKRNTNIIKRRKMRGEGGLKIEFKDDKGIFCDECKHTKKNKRNKKAYYCDICDLSAYKAGALKAWGRFEYNDNSGCMMFKKRLFKIK